MISKGIIYFKDGHTEEITSIATLRDIATQLDIVYIATESGNYTYSINCEYEGVLPCDGNPAKIIYHDTKFFKRELDSHNQAYLVEIDNIKQITIYDKETIVDFI